MTRILIHIACGVLLAQTCSIGSPLGEPLQSNGNWEIEEVYFDPDWFKCNNANFFDVRCPTQYILIVDKPG